MPFLALTLSFILTTSTANAAKPRALAPPPKVFETYSKVSGLWQGNKVLYCNPAKAIEQTLAEIKLLKEVKTASFNAHASEIMIETKSGGHGSIDVDNAPKHKRGEVCVD